MDDALHFAFSLPIKLRHLGAYLVSARVLHQIWEEAQRAISRISQHRRRGILRFIEPTHPEAVIKNFPEAAYMLEIELI